MKYRLCLAASALAFSAFLAAPAVAQNNSMPAHIDANGMPTDHSTQAEHAATAGLNNQAADANTKADAQSDAQAGSQADQNNAQYQAQQQQYQDQLRQNRAAQSEYQDRTVAYEALRTRYADQRLAYHRAMWPDRYEHWTLQENSADLTGQRVEIVNGDRVGTVTDVARSPNGKVEALRVKLDSDKVVWIDQADVRYDHAGGIVMTNLNRADLRQMADERM